MPMSEEHKKKMADAREAKKQADLASKAKHLSDITESVKKGLGEGATDEQVKAEVDRILKGEELEADVSKSADALYKASKALEQFKNPPKTGSDEYTEAERAVIRTMRKQNKA